MTATGIKLLANGYSAVIAASIVPTCASFAQGTATYGGARDRVEIQVPVTASISGRCGFSSLPSSSVQLGNLEDGFSREIPFILNCNTPMRMAVLSRNGGLEAPVKPMAGRVNRLDYTVTLHLVGTGGTTAVASCEASSLAASSTASCDFRGTASATRGLRLPNGSRREEGSYLRIAAPATPGLVASDAYTDTLALTLSPSA